MKKTFLFMCFIIAFSANADTLYKFTTSCGIITYFEMKDDATVSQVKQAASTANFNSCGTTPTKITITL